MDISEFYQKAFLQKNNSYQVDMSKNSPIKQIVNVYTELDILARDKQILILQNELAEAKKNYKSVWFNFNLVIDKLRTGELIDNPDYDNSYENYKNYIKFYKSI